MQIIYAFITTSITIHPHKRTMTKLRFKAFINILLSSIVMNLQILTSTLSFLPPFLHWFACGTFEVSCSRSKTLPRLRLTQDKTQNATTLDLFLTKQVRHWRPTHCQCRLCDNYFDLTFHCIQTFPTPANQRCQKVLYNFYD